MANHVSLAFCKSADTALGPFAFRVHDGLSQNALLFPAPPVDLDTLRSTADTFESALAASRGGGVNQTAAKNSARQDLVALLRELAAFVEGKAKGEAQIILASGFLITSRGYSPQTPLVKPTELRVRLGKSTELILSVKRVRNAKSFEVQIRTANGSWQPAGTFTQGRKMILENLTPGTLYQIRVRAIGGSTGYSDWSDTVSHMCL